MTSNESETNNNTSEDVEFLYTGAQETHLVHDKILDLIDTHTPVFKKTLTDQTTLVLVPYRWSRTVHQSGSQFTVTYTTPSGFILRSKEAVTAHLKTANTCRCHLNMNLSITEVFDFNAKTAAVLLPPPSTITAEIPTPCQQWLASKSGGDRFTMGQFLDEHKGNFQKLGYDQSMVTLDGQLNEHMAFELAGSGVMPVSFAPASAAASLVPSIGSSSNLGMLSIKQSPRSEDEEYQLPPAALLEPVVLLNESVDHCPPSLKKVKFSPGGPSKVTLSAATPTSVITAGTVRTYARQSTGGNGGRPKVIYVNGNPIPTATTSNGISPKKVILKKSPLSAPPRSIINCSPGTTLVPNKVQLLEKRMISPKMTAKVVTKSKTTAKTPNTPNKRTVASSTHTVATATNKPAIITIGESAPGSQDKDISLLNTDLTSPSGRPRRLASQVAESRFSGQLKQVRVSEFGKKYLLTKKK